MLLKGISEDMDAVVLKILKNLKFYPICRLTKLTCHSFIYAGKRPDVLKSETKNSLLFRVIAVVRILTTVTGSWIPDTTAHWNEGKVMTAHEVFSVTRQTSQA